jgi:hypothetical protein
MRRHFESLRPADLSAVHSVPDGIFLVRVKNPVPAVTSTSSV